MENQVTPVNRTEESELELDAPKLSMEEEDEYPPLVISDVPQRLVSSLHKTWTEVAVQKPTNRHAKILKPSPVVPNKPKVEETNPFCFLIKVLRSADSISLQGQLDRAKLEADEKARLADSIQAQIQEANIRIHELDYENTKYEEREARVSIKTKRMEIDSLMYVITNGNDALCVEDINSQLEKLEDPKQHETLTPKQQKKILKEIRQLKERREELLDFLGTEDEIRQAIELRDEAEVRLKMLRKELDILQDNAVRAKAAALEAQKKRDAENGNINGLQAKLRAAIDARKLAYARLQSLKNKLSAENKLFSQYKKDASAAKSCAFSGNKKALHHLCTNQVEKLMQSWNTSDKFRQEYVKSNVGSTVRRLGTLDGRSLGHGEKPPPVLPAPQERVDRMMMMTKNSATESKQESELTKMRRRENIETEKKEQRRLEELAEAEVEAQKKQEEEKKEKARQKRLRKKEKMKAIKAEKSAMDTDDTIKICESAAAESSNKGVELPEIPQGQQFTRNRESKQESELTKKAAESSNEGVELPEIPQGQQLTRNRQSKQESELTKNAAEEMQRRENIEEAEKKEQRRLEELAKAEVEAQKKQDEEKEKARRKRLRKNEKKKAKKAKAAMDEICETAAESSNEEDVEMPQGQVTRTLSLHNRSWRSYRQLMWTGLISFLVYIVFLFGDVDVLLKLRGLDWQFLNR